ncbi:hypothetical protein [Streptomyces sp. N35]|uniref:hypothetical protein n=1 Tax=Streptomyces sp. N35 TaxID=2795730 RepID=UPI0018F628F8|nr:hypothetical protein [Streptomyces sp. N35]
MEQKEPPKPLRPRALDTPRLQRLMERFAQRHTTADNPRRDEFPDIQAPGAELAVVVFARTHKRALPRLARRAEAIDRLVLVQQLRRILDEEELAALQDGNAAGARWRQLGDPLGIRTKNGTVQRMQRLRVAVELGPSALREPAVLRAHERGETGDDASRSRWIGVHHLRVREAAADLLHHRASLATDEVADDWLDDMSDLLERAVEPSVEASLITHLRFALEEVDRVAAENGVSASASADCEAARRAASRLVGGYRRRSAP